MEKLQRVPKKQSRKPKKEVKPRIRHTQEIKDKAAKYYILGLTLPEISKLLNEISIRTLEKWQLSQHWTELKNPINIKERVLQLNEAGKTKKEIAKLINRDQSTVFRWIKEVKGKKQIR